MSVQSIKTVEQTPKITTQTFPIPQHDIIAPRDDVTRFILKAVYEAEDKEYSYGLDELVKYFMLFGPESRRSHIASVRELKRAIVWLTQQGILNVTPDKYIVTNDADERQSVTWLQAATNEAIRHFRQSFGKKGKTWFYGNA